MNFDLKQLIINNMDFNQQELSNFRAFLRKQSSLEAFGSFTIKFDFETTKLILNELKMLNTLFFYDTVIQITDQNLKLKKNSRIKTFEINYNHLPNLATFIVNLIRPLFKS
jgi:hypothetical protein